MASEENVLKEWKKMKVQELRDELSRRGLSTAGLRPSLIERLEKSSSPARKPEIAHPSEDINFNNAAAVKEDEDEEEEEHERDATSSKDEDSCGSIISPDKCEPAKCAGTVKPSNDGGVTTSPPVEALTDLEKKRRRAERFGLVLQLTEEEKRTSRAVRFCESSNGSLNPNSPCIVGTKLSEEERRKARAERFGFSAHSAANDEVKKKARLTRFGLDAKLDSLKDDKRKARAARFTPALDGNTSEANKKLKLEMSGA